MPRQPHDRFFKGLLADRAAALGLLQLTLPAAALEGVSADALRLEDPALSAGGRARTPDRLILVRGPGRRTLRVIVEHQTRPDPDMDLRLLDALVALHRQRAGREVAPAVAIVVYQGHAPWRAPGSLLARARPSEALRAALGDLLAAPSYGLLDLHRIDPATLPGPPALRLGLGLLRAAHTRDPWSVLSASGPELREIGLPTLSRHLGYAKEIARHPPPPGFGRDLAAAAGYTLEEVFMSYASQLRREGFKEGIKEGIKEGVETGRAVGIKEGEIVGQRTLLRRLLERRFGALTTTQIARLDAATLEEVAAWTDDLLSVSSADALLGP